MFQEAPIADPIELTGYIESHYHARHRKQLPELVRLAAKVEAAHAGHDSVPTGLSELLDRLNVAMESHMKKEELVIFPLIREGGMEGIELTIAVMRDDHDDHLTEMEQIRRITGGLSLPADACRTWVGLYVGLKRFVSELEEHLHLENDILFPIFEPGGSVN